MQCLCLTLTTSSATEKNANINESCVTSLFDAPSAWRGVDTGSVLGVAWRGMAWRPVVSKPIFSSTCSKCTFSNTTGRRIWGMWRFYAEGKLPPRQLDKQQMFEAFLLATEFCHVCFSRFQRLGLLAMPQNSCTRLTYPRRINLVRATLPDLESDRHGQDMPPLLWTRSFHAPDTAIFYSESYFRPTSFIKKFISEKLSETLPPERKEENLQPFMWRYPFPLRIHSCRKISDAPKADAQDPGKFVTRL